MNCDFCEKPMSDCKCQIIHPETLSQTTFNVEGMKDKAGKPDLQIVDEYYPRALVALSEIALFGVDKYGRNTFAGVPIIEYEKAMRRHQRLKAMGEAYDQESGKPHSWHIQANATIIVEIEERLKELAGK